jgi:hypothetical protein
MEGGAGNSNSTLLSLALARCAHVSGARCYPLLSHLLPAACCGTLASLTCPATRLLPSQGARLVSVQGMCAYAPGPAPCRALAAQPWSPGEAAELAERRRRLALYLLRSPLLDVLTRWDY